MSECEDPFEANRRVIEKMEKIPLIEKFISELLLWMKDTHWIIEEITDEIPDKYKKQETSKEVIWDHEYVWQEAWGITGDSWRGQILIPLPDSEKYLQIGFEC